MEPPAQLLTLPQEMLARPPSRADGVDAPTEHAYRIWACELVQDMGIALRLAQVVMATAQSLVQRFYYRKSLAAYDGHIVAMAALFLAAKVEEQPRRMRDVVNVCYHAKLRRQGKPLRPITLGGGLYLTWKAGLIRTERVLLKETGFSTYNLMAHPHKFILYYVRTLGEGRPADALAQAAWAYLNDSLRLDLCVRYSAESIACAALYLAARATRFPLPATVPWHAVFSTSRAEMHDIAEEILTLYDDDGGGDSGGGDDADAGFGGSATGAAVLQSSSSSSSSSAAAAGGSTVRTRLDSPTLRRGPGRPLRWLPSLRPDARPGDDEDEGEERGAGAAASGGWSQQQPQSQLSATTSEAPAATGPGGGVPPSTAALTEIVAAAAAAAAAKAAQLALSASSSAAAAAPSAATGGDAAGPRREEHHRHHHRHHHGGGGSSRRGSIGSDGDGAGRERREQPRRDDKDAGGGARRSRFRSRSRSR
jgi:cyclin L